MEDKKNILDEIFETFETDGHGDYDGEAVSIYEHLLQAAYLAEKDNAEDNLIAAALLHDYGDLILRKQGKDVDPSVDTKRTF